MLLPLMVIKRKLIAARHGAVSDVKPYSHPAEVVCRAVWHSKPRCCNGVSDCRSAAQFSPSL
jgi:hypothetical protein